jgi:hypothetical protein
VRAALHRDATDATGPPVGAPALLTDGVDQ